MPQPVSAHPAAFKDLIDTWFPTGREIWRYDRKLPDGLRLCCNASNPGLAMHRNRLFMATRDTHLVALDRRTGAVIFDVTIDATDRGYSASAAPLIVRDNIIVGISGGEFASRGFLAGYDVTTGKRRWRFWTVPGPGTPGRETWPSELRVKSMEPHPRADADVPRYAEFAAIADVIGRGS